MKFLHVPLLIEFYESIDAWTSNSPNAERIFPVHPVFNHAALVQSATSALSSEDADDFDVADSRKTLLHDPP